MQSFCARRNNHTNAQTREGLVTELCSKRYGDFAGSETEYDPTIPCCYEKVDIIPEFIKKI